MATTRYIQGSFVKVKAQFTSVNNVPIDPTTVTLRYKNPENEIVVLSTEDTPTSLITNPSTGCYETELTFNIPGKWIFRWEGSGENGSVSETSINVSESQVI